ncbi:MAG: DEAD/DEAH box helicase [Vicinamibacteria bacterium]|nr:DEAD/DEAH box helicase [Vicinamibacteria bacterium]
MLWSQVIAGQVPALARARGATYFDQGRVVALSGRGHSLLARVRGTLVYDVRIEVDGAQLNATCTCPAAGRAPCKHVWAALLEAERLGRISSPAEVSPAGASGPSPSGLTRGPDRPLALWRDRLEVIATTQGTTGLRPPAPALAQEGDEILYVLDLPSSLAQGALHVETHIARRRRDGQPGEPRPFPIGRGEAALLPDAADRRALLLLLGARRGLYEEHLGRADTFRIGADAVPALVEVLARTGRARVQVTREGAPVALRWQAEPGFELQLRVRERDEDYVLAASLRAGEVERPLADAALVLRQGAVFFADGVAGPFDDRGLWPFVRDLRQHRELAVPIRHASRLLSALAAAGPGPLAAVELPADLQVAVVQAAPRPRLRVDPDPRDPRRLLAQLAFDYDGGLAPDDAGPAAFHFDAATRRLLVRDTEAEEGARDELLALGLRRVNTGAQFYLAPRRLAEVVRALAPRGFLIEVDGRVQRPSGSVRYRVSSGVDWFDLDAEVDFGGGATARLPALLEAARTGSATVVLDDGSSGLLPEEWLARQGFLRALGELEGGRLRFRSAQATLIGELLAEASSLEADEGFHEARARLRAFSRVRAADPPAGFHGTLRPYQREGLGWLRFLREFSLGGCLADDMGLGKTVQVLALLEERRATARHPSLVVVPRSLVFNWQEEAARFVPGLRVRDHTGLERARGGEAFADADLVLTTYGTLRRDIRMLEGLRFDYVILDEAQNVKNHRTEAARAVRRLRADHRLALTGTPLENHLGELRSLLDFLNPGLLGASSAFRGGDAPGDEVARRALAEGIRPFVLRRTKEQVEGDLPAKTEQTLHCALEGKAQTLYRELATHYRRTLLAQVDERGMARSKIQVLEALLRLRQAACHPGLVDKRYAAVASAKIEALVPLLHEVVAEGHKALVFSQFTSFLALVRQRLGQEGLIHEYLDGRTRDRASRVKRFQEDTACPLFLVSLKAGGTGLNLTAADYVFLLDPWWNPAVESQAIDRAHRIGQQRHVFAYRLIATDTVEEKVLALQQGKRELFDAILGEKLSLIRSLRREDLEHLLS